MSKKKSKIENHFFGDYEEGYRNVGEEFLKAVKGHKVVCMDFVLDDFETSVSFVLKCGYTRTQFREVLNTMMHCWYDCGYGMQYLTGIIWCSNGIWFERWEYDGSEGWEIKGYPEIPEDLK